MGRKKNRTARMDTKAKNLVFLIGPSFNRSLRDQISGTWISKTGKKQEGYERVLIQYAGTVKGFLFSGVSRF
jgi:hypothetical protein